jgi:hypothetical protein
VIVTSPVFVETLLAFKTLTFAAAWAGWTLRTTNTTETSATTFFIYSPIFVISETVKVGKKARILKVCELGRHLPMF